MAVRDGEVVVTARVTTLKGADAGVYYAEALPSYYLDGDELLGPIRPYADDHEQTEPIFLEADRQVDPVDPDVDVVAVGEVAPLERLVVGLPSARQTCDRRR